MRKLRWLWYACIALGFIATYFGLLEPAKTWKSTTMLVESMETWWSAHAVHPIASAFFAGLAVSTVLLPELCLHLKPVLFPFKPRPDISAADAFLLILARSKLRRKYAKHWKQLAPADRHESSQLESQNIKNRVEAALIRRLHTVLRSGDLKSWGCPPGGTEIEEEIPSEKWAAMEMLFEKRDVESGAVHAWHSSADPLDRRLAYARIRFCKKQLTRIFPLSIYRQKVDYTPYPKTNLTDI